MSGRISCVFGRPTVESNYQACRCHNGYTGRHCDVLIVVPSEPQTYGDELTWIVLALVAAALLIVAGILIFRYLDRRMRMGGGTVMGGVLSDEQRYAARHRGRPPPPSQQEIVAMNRADTDARRAEQRRENTRHKAMGAGVAKCNVDCAPVSCVGR